jgi:glycosyltransferase involved in cell wall biosynthesis
MNLVYLFLIVATCQLVALEKVDKPLQRQLDKEQTAPAVAKAPEAQPAPPSKVVAAADHSTVCLNMIVKNESQVICRCLETLKPFIDYWVIVDTGSTDGTQQIIKDFMKDIPGELHERPWINFAHNRNEALDLARGKADYIFAIDADDKIEISPTYKKAILDRDSYLIDIKYGGMTYGRIALIKGTKPWRWEGAVHEVLVCHEPFSQGFLEGVIMRIIGGGDRSQDPKKFLKDAALLEEALRKDPTHARSQFYLAQSYRDAEVPELALTHYQKRVDMGGWDQEVFWSLYQVAQLKERLNKAEDEIVKAYNKAYLYRPMRLEPLYQLCRYYRCKENYLMGYLVGQLALRSLGNSGQSLLGHPLSDHSLTAQQMQIKAPTDVLFVESWIYDYGFLLEYSICAYWLGKYQESKDICQYILAQPELPQHVKECVERNLKFSNDKLGEKLSVPVIAQAAG